MRHIPERGWQGPRLGGSRPRAIMAALAIAVGAANALPVAAADPAASGEPVTLTFVTFVPDRYYQPLFEAYRKDHPNVTFNVEPISLESSVSGVE